jgi:hypothetical protein
MLSVILDLRRGGNEVFRLVGSYAAKGGLVSSCDPRRWDRYIVPKRRYQTTLRCLTTQKTSLLYEFTALCLNPAVRRSCVEQHK